MSLSRGLARNVRDRKAILCDRDIEAALHDHVKPAKNTDFILPEECASKSAPARIVRLEDAIIAALGGIPVPQNN